MRAGGDLQRELRAHPPRRADDTDQANRTLRETRLPALACAACQALLPAYAELLLSGRDARAAYPAVARHLEDCAECALALADLLEIAAAEDASPSAARAPDLSFLGRTPP
jgi:hypothetical protein